MRLIYQKTNHDHNMKHISSFSLIFLLLLSTQLFAQRIEKVQFTVVGNNIEVYYYVAGLKFNQTLTTELFVSTDGGVNFQGPLKFASGDVGAGIINGRHKIIWEATKEIPLNKVNLIFDVRGEILEKPNKWDYFAAYTGTLATPIGLRVGLLGKTGYYLSFQSNFTPGIKGSYTYENNAITDYTRFAWYEFTSKHKKVAYNACAGATFQTGRDFFIYAGAGYGAYEILYEIKEYSYEDNALLDTNYGKDNSVSATGPVLEAGIIIRTGKVIFIGGGNLLDFKTPNLTAGIGISF